MLSLDVCTIVTFERDKIQALTRSHGDYDSLMHLSEVAKCELNWWLNIDSHLCRRIQHAPVPLLFRRMPVTLVGAFGVFLMVPFSLKGFGPGANVLYILM